MSSQLASGATSVNKIPRTKSLYWKLAVSTVLITSAIGGLQLYYATIAVRNLVSEVNQQNGWNLASEIANRVQPLVREDYDRDDLQRLFFDLSSLNPGVEFYLLNDKGKVIDFMGDGKEVMRLFVNLEPILLATQDFNPDLPLWGDSPSRYANERKIFSVAPIVIRGNPGYLYLVLEGRDYDYHVRGAGQFFVARTLLVGLVMIALFGLSLGYLLFTYLTKSFRKLTSVVTDFQAGNFDSRVEIEGEDEIGLLGSALNLMAERTDEATTRLIQTDENRRELIANISHDLRNPMTAIRGAVQTLRLHEDKLPTEKRSMLLKIVEDNVVRQEVLVRDLFELSKLNATERLPELEHVDIGDLVQDAVIALRPDAKNKNIAVSVSMPETSLVCAVDASMIDRVVINLMRNALAYTSEGGSVEVSLREENGLARVGIMDSGVGISEEDIKKIFDAMYRTDKARSRDTGGAGLGLAIVKRILELHHTSIDVHSKLGEGSEFYFFLPLVEHNDAEDS